MADNSAGTYRILALDGGGTWALIQAAALHALYGDIKGRALLANFDLVAANSGGSIVAAGLAEDLTPTEILEFFLSEPKRRSVFVGLSWLQKLHFPDFLLRFAKIGPRYLTPAKLLGLEALAPNSGSVPLDKLPNLVPRTDGNRTEFLITAMDYDVSRAVFFRSNSESRAGSFPPRQPVTLAQAVHAASNAPVNYFDVPALLGQDRFWDGALAGLNNPVLAGVIEALANGVPAARIRALSLGTGTVRLPLAVAGKPSPFVLLRKPPRLLDDLRKVADSILDDPPDAATFMAHVALGGSLPTASAEPVTLGPVVRMNPELRPVRPPADWGPPEGLTSAEFTRLANMNMDALAQGDVELIRRFAGLWIEGKVPNQPIRESREFECEIGQERFKEAANAWHACLIS